MLHCCSGCVSFSVSDLSSRGVALLGKCCFCFSLSRLCSCFVLLVSGIFCVPRSPSASFDSLTRIFIFSSLLHCILEHFLFLFVCLSIYPSVFSPFCLSLCSFFLSFFYFHSSLYFTFSFFSWLVGQSVSQSVSHSLTDMGIAVA